MTLKRKVAIMSILVLVLIVTCSLASGFFNSVNSSNLSKKDSEFISSAKGTLSDSPSNSSMSTPTLPPVPMPTATPTPTPIPIPVDFTIKEDNLVLTVNVDLNDGMNRDEAILVAQQLFAYVHSHATYELKSAEVNDADVWTVSLPWGAVSPDGFQESHGHYFIATIDPSTRIVDYSTCY